MGVMRTACCGFVAVLCSLAWAAPAVAADHDVLVLGSDGRVHARVDRALPDAAMPAPPRRHARPALASAAGKKKRRTVVGELKRLRDRGAITPDEYALRRADYEAARKRARKLRGTRATQMNAVLRTLEDIAARRRLTRSRLVPLWLTLDRNLEWWTEGTLLGTGQRIEFEGSELVWQYYPGQGVQLQMLGNFGKLNALWGSRANTRLEHMLDELLPLAAERAGGVAWEYYFSFGGGRPPWVSGMAEGTAVQALARAATRLDREADVLPVAKRALGIFGAPTPQGVRVPAAHGDHYALYSFAPNLRVLNGFLQSLVGLYDYARVGADPRATALFEAGESEARHEVPDYDTGAWSLYSRGSNTHESSLSYHDLLQGFLANLCKRLRTDVYCTTSDHFVKYKSVPPVVEVKPRTLRGGRPGRVSFTLSKISDVDLQIRRGGKLVESRPFGAVGYGNRSFGWDVPRRAGQYTVQLIVRDLAGNPAAATGAVKVLKPKRKRRP